MGRPALALIVVACAVAGGAAALAIGAAAGWVGADTIVVERAVPGRASRGQAVPTSAKPLQGDAFDPARLYDARADGVVTILALFPGHGTDNATAQAQGSGFVVSANGTILTNSHVITTAGEVAPGEQVEPATQVYVEFADGDRAAATIVGWDPFSDVGVLRVDPAAHALAAVPLGDSDSVRVGEPVAAIGSPFGQAGSLSVGVVSAVGRSIDSLTSRYDIADAIQVDAPINRGNSGGPLFNARGEVIGINAQIRSESGNAEGVGFAVPINTAARALQQLLETGEVHYAWIGVKTQTLTASIAAELGLGVQRGAAVDCVVPGSPAERSGLRGADRSTMVDGREFAVGGDVVVAIDGQIVATSEDVSRAVAGLLFPGKPSTFAIVRDGERLEVEVVPADRSERSGDCAS